MQLAAWSVMFSKFVSLSSDMPLVATVFASVTFYEALQFPECGQSVITKSTGY